MPDQNTQSPEEISYRPDLPDWGVYLRWPVDGDAWIHPEDVDVASRLIPSGRVFRRSKWDGQHYWLHYGQFQIRVRPTMWLNVSRVDLEVGQQVELLSNHGENDAGIFYVGEIIFDTKQKEFEFHLRDGEMPIARVFRRSDLRPIHVRHHLRAGFFKHQAPKSTPPPDLDTLDVGTVFDG